MEGILLSCNGILSKKVLSSLKVNRIEQITWEFHHFPLRLKWTWTLNQYSSVDYKHFDFGLHTNFEYAHKLDEEKWK